MKKLLLLLLVFAFGANMKAQVFWQEMPTGFTAASRGVNQISYGDANNVWITVYDGVTTTNVIREYAHSVNGGSTWTGGVINLGSTTLGIACIAGIDANTAFVGAFPDTGGLGGIWKTVNGGSVWTKQPTALYTSTTSFTDIVAFWDANNGVTIGDPDTPTTFEIYTTTNGGTNWVRVPAGNVPAPLTGEYAYTRGYTSIGNAIWFGTNKGRIYKSLNKGLNWTVSVSPITDFQTGNMAFQSATEGVLVTDDWQFFRTIDGGTTWTPEVPTGTYRNGAITYVPGTCTYVSLGNDLDLDQRGSSYSTDAGLTWIDINTLGDDTNNDNGSDVAFYDATHGLASGFNTSAAVGGIFKFVNTDPLIFACPPLATTGFNAEKANVYPNPTLGMLNIDAKDISQISVYDVLGKEVSNTKYSSVNTASLNLSSLNSGVYMVKVTTASGSTSTTKVVKQ